MIINPTIIVSAYNRPEALKRLLNSLANALYNSSDITLIISLDKSDTNEVESIADDFDWRYGSKKVIKHNKRLGLKKHILSCGDLSHECEAIIVLEDDLFVSPYFYKYAKQAYEFYKNDATIAGVSLYNYQVAESCFYPFNAIDDGSDVYFMQIASSWGQLWTKSKWNEFKSWYNKNPSLTENDRIPNYLFRWGKNSWKKHFIHYLIDTKKYFVFPRLSLTTNFEEPGTNASTKNVFHVPLQLSEYNYLFTEIEKSKSVYDAWFELTPHCLNKFTTTLKGFNYEVDLYGSKELEAFESEYVLTSKHAENEILSYGIDLFPFESNIALNLTGSRIRLYKVFQNLFTHQKLEIKNILDKIEGKKDLGISILIPIETLNSNDLKRTIESIHQQNYTQKECFIITNSIQSKYIEQHLVDCNLKINIIETEEEFDLARFLNLGFKYSSMELISWLNQGSAFSNDTFLNVDKIFQSFSGINWIRGIYEKVNNSSPEKCKTLKHRLTPKEAYKRLKNDSLNLSVELDFYRSYCLRSLPDNNQFSEDFFLKFISTYQLISVVSEFGHKKMAETKIDPTLKKAFLKKHSHLSKNNSWKLLFLNLLLQTFLSKSRVIELLYPLINDFPDVLRHDGANNTFYYSKH